jgi:hypothetical protein
MFLAFVLSNDHTFAVANKEAKRLGVPRQSIIKIWVADRLEKVS